MPQSPSLSIVTNYFMKMCLLLWRVAALTFCVVRRGAFRPIIFCTRLLVTIVCMQGITLSSHHCAGCHWYATKTPFQCGGFALHDVSKPGHWWELKRFFNVFFFDCQSPSHIPVALEKMVGGHPSRVKRVEPQLWISHLWFGYILDSIRHRCTPENDYFRSHFRTGI